MSANISAMPLKLKNKPQATGVAEKSRMQVPILPRTTAVGEQAEIPYIDLLQVS